MTQQRSMKDKNGTNLVVGDRVSVYLGDNNCHAYDLIICNGRDGHYGKLVCDKNHPCRNIMYALVPNQMIKVNKWKN